ncbi:MAG: tRNA (adenosine(37)-N6)-dimethylallyltransferase MiaA [Candidatus Moraniibacteriota bacterium]
MRNNKIIIILGPTASGKSSAAIRLAKKFNGEIISADSRQIYRGMDVGTGKVTGSIGTIIPSLPKNLNKNTVFVSEGVPHYMIDIVSPRTDFSVAKFKKRATRHIEDILKRGKVPIICGGTGFWIQSIVDDIIYPQVKPDWKLREKLEKQSLEKLLEKLKKLDPQRAKTVDIKNKIRLIRAIEICQALGNVPAINLGPKTKTYEFLQLGIEREKEILHERIKLNVTQRFNSGMINEVENLHNSGLSWKKIMSFGLSYKLIPLYLKGEISSQADLIEKIYLAEKQYAKRQLTWFKKDKRIKWLTDYKEIEQTVENFIHPTALLKNK